MSAWPFEPATARYANLATFRRNGREVRTPVWLAGAGERYYLFSEADAGKVKRIRANGRARLAACDMRGNLQSEWLEAKATLVTDAGTIADAYAALHNKYGWQMAVTDFFSKLTGRYGKRAIIALEITGAA